MLGDKDAVQILFIWWYENYSIYRTSCIYTRITIRCTPISPWGDSNHHIMFWIILYSIWKLNEMILIIREEYKTIPWWSWLNHNKIFSPVVLLNLPGRYRVPFQRHTSCFYLYYPFHRHFCKLFDRRKKALYA